MNKRLEKNDDQFSADIPLCDRIAAEIINRTKTAAKEEFAAFELANANIEKLRGISQDYASQLEEKKARLKAERSTIEPNADIASCLQRRRILEREIAETELSTQEFSAEFWPVAVKDANDIKIKINDRLFPIVSEMKLDYQAQLDALFLESISIMEAFRDALHIIRLKQEFSEIGGHLSTFASFDVSPLLFKKMNDLRLCFGMIDPKKSSKLYEVVVRCKEPIDQ